MRNWMLVVLLGMTAACARKVTLQTTPAAPVEVSIRLTNNATQAVSVYVQAGGPEVFLKQVSANTTEVIPVPNVASGTSARLRATLADGSRSYTRESAMLTGVFDWQVP